MAIFGWDSFSFWSETATRPTYAFSDAETLIEPNDEVVSAEIVTTSALLRVAPFHVFIIGNWLKVIRSKATSVLAKMIQLEALRDWTIGQGIGQSMNEPCFVPKSDDTVALILLRSRPYPTSYRIVGYELI
jgi:hypothetical protein